MTIYALRVEEYVDKVFNSLGEGEGRFGWSYIENANLYQLRDRIRRSGWKSLNKEEMHCYQDFLLDLEVDDYVVYINVPSYGQCTLARVTGEYEWRYEDEDFNHRFPVDPHSIQTFRRNDDIVPAALSRRFKLQGRWWRVHAKQEFKSLLQSLKIGTVSKPRTPESNLKVLSQSIRPLFSQIAEKIHRTHPAKDLEPLIERVFKNIPSVINVTRKQGKADQGADLIVEFETETIPGLVQTVQTQTLVVQVKSYGRKHNYTSAVKDIKRAFDYYPSATMGLIISTAESAGEEFERELENLQEKSGKPVILLIGADLAAFFLRHGGNLLG